MTHDTSRDVMSSRLRMALLYALPGLSIYLTGQLGDRRILTIVWPVAFLIMGLACVANARRCGRVHCYFTGPLFLLASVLSAMHGWNVINLGPRAWDMIGFGTLVLALVLYYVPEALWGRYYRTRQAS